MRLIDADALFKELNDKNIPWNRQINDIIMAQPTAYDVEKVVTELERASKTMMPVIPTNHAIYIVKNGSNPELFKYYGVGIGETAVIKKFGINIEERGGVE